MRRMLFALGLVTISFSKPAFACGAGYGTEVTIKPSQTIVVTYRGGEQGYIFQPHFCGAASAFGLLLPVPAPLTKSPTLADSNLFQQLETVAAPIIETVEVCAQNGLFSGSSKGDNSGGADRSVGDGVDVVSSGRVGQFQWELLKADSTQSFTDWLDVNSFAYETAAKSAFDHYVQAGWYFVAFRVPTGSDAPPAGYRLCGDFGPISLSFTTNQAAIPTRIATANDPSHSFSWRIFTVAEHTQTLASSNVSDSVTATRTFAGAITSNVLASVPAVASIANAGEWITAFNSTFYGGQFNGDLVLSQNAADTEYRDHQYAEKVVNCGVFGCTIRPAVRHSMTCGAIVSVLAVLAFAVRRRRY